MEPIVLRPDEDLSDPGDRRRTSIRHITQSELLRHLTETEAANGWLQPLPVGPVRAVEVPTGR